MAEEISVFGGRHHHQVAAAANEFIAAIASGAVDISGNSSHAFRSNNSYGDNNFRVEVDEIRPTQYGVPIKLHIYVVVLLRGRKPAHVAGTNHVYISNNVDNTLNGAGQDRNNWNNNYMGYRVALFGRLR